ncbi:peptidase C54 [Actibacterium mucosum KCTC 23349]|uniref:Peptidase C54 n=1 Tax=Actibacterium mucosum KCTC 23349 TaxID=1454373 RepID=A0A037ZKC4_9RHOB|nr:rhomboid family intramembrane serine protease [Actibacterium mucosum]KAJ56553.1 peptidase C54 [Actibacterium mucosum KCTC 23349]
MFPIRDHNPSERAPYVAYALMAANILIFLSYWGIMDEPRNIKLFYDTWALVPAQISEGVNYHGLITSMFLHGGLMHLAGNMLFLWIFGDNLEDELGHVGFALFYFAGGLAAGLAQYLAEPLSPVPVVGASGAIAAVMGGYLLLFPRARVDVLFIFIIIFKVFPLPAWVMLGGWFIWQIISGSLADSTGGGVAYWAHAGGFLAGLVLMAPIWLHRGGTAYWDRTEGHPPHPEAQYSRSSIPQVRRKR